MKDKSLVRNITCGCRVAGGVLIALPALAAAALYLLAYLCATRFRLLADRDLALGGEPSVPTDETPKLQPEPA